MKFRFYFLGGDITSTQIDNESVRKKNPDVITVHVQDEGKGAQCDFSCDRELLVQEMGYFKDYLIQNGKFIQEVEILVHCDIKVFDWLMRYVKRRSDPKNYEECWLSVSNVLALLISSDFLKMDGLSQKCLIYFCEHINAIIASPCSLSCLNDDLIRRIVDHLTIADLEKIKDRKDKIKSKLFFRKIEQLFDPKYTSPESPENASRLFQCLVCERILTQHTAMHAPCLPWRRMVSRSGNLVPVHQPYVAFLDPFTRPGTSIRRSSSCFGSPVAHWEQSHTDEVVLLRPTVQQRTPSSMSISLPSRMPSTPNLNSGPQSPCSMSIIIFILRTSVLADKFMPFSATELLTQWYRELGNWRLVFWRLWSTINLLNCTRCQRKFPIIEYGDGCFYHSEKPILFEKNSVGTSASANLGVTPTTQSPAVPASPKSCKAWQRSKEETSKGQDKVMHREDKQNTHNLYNPVELVYPCCGFRQYRFDPFEIPSVMDSPGCHRNHHVFQENAEDLVTRFTVNHRDLIGSWAPRRSFNPNKFGCHRNHHVFQENAEDLVTRFTVNHRDLIGSWAPRRSFNPNNAPGLLAVGGYPLPKLDAEHLRLQEDLLRRMPVGLMLACLNQLERESDKKASINQCPTEIPYLGSQPHPVFYEVPGGCIVHPASTTGEPSAEHGSHPWLCPNGIISFTMHDRVWDSMKCYRSNQDSQRQDDLRRMQRFAEFLRNQRMTNGQSIDRSNSRQVRQFPGGIYSRLEAQWRTSTGNVGPVKITSAQVVK
ncbi:hypothetical protein FBUS_00487 [Fasciolopsis buskii]|uniref:SANT and BTB domain-containing protein n=1 Tax=Fasciolopsis buskii TaxID=27845 RepID=A0A8E0VNK8_9TREM|nr:hypothetical protein FBUS_00487 [Fasciolopsis buski]